MFESIFPFFLCIGGAIYLVMRGIRAFERRGSSPEEIAALSDQLSELRELHWTMRMSIDRLREEQEFAGQLLGPPASGDQSKSRPSTA